MFGVIMKKLTMDEKILRLYNDVAQVVGVVAWQGQVNEGDKVVVGNVPLKSLLLDSVQFRLDDPKIEELRGVKPKTLAEILNTLVGLNIVDRDVQERVVLISISESSPVPMLLVKDDGTVYLKCADRFAFDSNAFEDNRASGLEMKLSKSLLPTPMQLSYLTRGMQITPTYRITMQDGKVRIAAEVIVTNDIGKPFSDVDVTVIPGKINMHGYSEHFRFMAEEARGASAQVVRRVAADVELVEDEGQISYRLGKRNIPEGQSRFALFTTKQINSLVKYSALLNVGKCVVTAYLEFKAPETLPRGSVTVYREKTSGCYELSYECGTNINIDTTQKEADIVIPLRIPDTLEVKVTKESTKTERIRFDEARNDVYVTIVEYTAKIKNTGNEVADLSLDLFLKEFENLLSTNITPSNADDIGSYCKWDLKVEPNKTTTLTYQVRLQYYKQLPHCFLYLFSCFSI